MRSLRLSLSLILPVLLGWAVPAAAQAPAAMPPQLEAARQAMITDPQAALRLATAAQLEAEKLAPSRDRSITIGTARWLRAEALLRTNQLDQAAPLINAALREIAPIREPIKLRADLLLSRGAVQLARAQAPAALASYQDAYRIYGAVGDARSQSIALQSIASLYREANDLDNAEKYFEQAANVYRGDPQLSLSTHNNRGNVLRQLLRADAATEEFRKALAIAREMQSPMLIARILGNIARAQLDSGRPTPAQIAVADEALREGLELVETKDAAGWKQPLLAIAAQLELRRGRIDRAAAYVERSFAGVDPATSSLAFRDAHYTAYQVYAQRGDAARALVHLEALKRLNDEATKVATETSSALMSARFDYANQELRIANLKAEELRKTAAFQRTLFLAIGGGTLVTIAMLAYFLVAMRRSRNQVRDANIVLNQTNVALEKALAAKTEFLATTSHEIRTPLNGILGMTQVMLSDPKLDAGTRDRIGIVHGAGVTMRSLVDDILDVAKMETGNLTVDPAPADLPATLREVTRMWEEQARDKGLSFTLDLAQAPHWIVTDAGRLRQIVFNLLSNAIKFTQAGGITVRVATVEDRLRLAIVDTGIGIPSAKRDEIFESFKQVDAGTTRKFGGTGLGLTICRNLARALGGDVDVESAEGQGSTFTIDLPLVLAEAPEGPVSADAATILVVDRNPIARSMLRTLIEQRGASAVFAANVEEAAAALAQGPVAHILADEATLRAGEADPLAQATALALAGGSTPVTILWAAPDETVQARLAEAGIALIAKPIAGAALIGRIVPAPKENSARGSKPRLVSRAA